MRANSSVRSQLREIEELTADLKDRSPHARANWQSWSGIGYPASSGNGRSPGIAKPVEAAVESVMERMNRDRFRGEWELHDQCIKLALENLRRAQRLACSATNTTAKAGAEGCSLCERVRMDGRPHPSAWQEVYSRSAPTGTGLPVTGRCSWHYDFAERWGVDASPKLSDWHLDSPGRQAPRELIKSECGEAYARVMGQRRAS